METNSSQNVAIPAEIEIDGVMVPTNHPAIRSMVQKAAKVEKDKVYETMESLRAENSRLKAAQTAPVQQPVHQEIPGMNTQSQAQQFRAAHQQENQAPIDKEAIDSLIAKRFDEALPTILQQRVAPLEQTIEALKAENLQAYRDKRIAELGDAVMPEMIQGNTKEEIESSIELSKALRAKYAPTQPAAPQPGTPAPATETTAPVAAAPVPPVTAPVVQQIQEVPAAPARIPQINMIPETQINVKEMSMDEFAKGGREQAFKDLAAKLGGANGGYPGM